MSKTLLTEIVTQMNDLEAFDQKPVAVKMNRATFDRMVAETKDVYALEVKGFNVLGLKAMIDPAIVDGVVRVQVEW